MYSGRTWFGVAPRMDTQNTHVFKESASRTQIIITIVGLIGIMRGGGVGEEDLYDDSTSTRVFTFRQTRLSITSSENQEKSGYGFNLGLLIILC